MKATVVLAGILLLAAFLSYGLDPPVKIWEKWYYTSYDVAYFRDIELTPSGNLFITGLIYDYTPPVNETYEALLVDQDGNMIWDVPHEFHAATGVDGLALSDGSYIITGSAVDSSGSSTQGLYLHKISSDGTTIWARLYDFPDTKEEGYGITCLPDGGFAVCGRVHGTGLWAGEAWLLRTDEYGDSLWTASWGTDIENYGKTVLYSNNEICLLAKGGADSLTAGITHLLFYDLEGNFLRGTDYPELTQHQPRGMCQASDGGYTFVTDVNPVIWHTDQYGETLWWHSIYNYGDEEGYDIIRTMDSGYLFCGWGGQRPQWDNDCMDCPVGEVDTGSTQDGWLVKYDEDGNTQWGILNEKGVNNHYYSVVQLPQGGYITCGTLAGSGYLVRYAPETGISSPDPASSLSLEVSPNPFSSVLSASFRLPEERWATLTVYDLYGRTVGATVSGSYPKGTSSIEWTPPPGLCSGCYFVRMSIPSESVTQSCVFIR